MLDAEGPVFGHVRVERFETLCSDLISARDPMAHIEIMRMALALGNARVQGMIAAMDDPFRYTPGAHERLIALIEELNALDTISSDEWRQLYDEGIDNISAAHSCSPAILSASLVNLFAYSEAEAETLTMYVMAAGIDEQTAQRTAASTVGTGIAACVLGEFERWAAILSKSNLENFIGLGDENAEACRFFQATTLRRFAKIRIIDDIESAQEEQASQKNAILQVLKPKNSANYAFLPRQV